MESSEHLTLFDSGDLGWACEAVTMVAATRGADLLYKFRGTEPLFDGDVVCTRAANPSASSTNSTGSLTGRCVST